MKLNIAVTLFWTLAVILASVFSVLIITVTLKRKYSKIKSILAWIALILAGSFLTYLTYSFDITNDITGIVGMYFLISIGTHHLCEGNWSTKLFISTMASLIANVSTFMLCGSTDSILGSELGLFETHPYTIKNISLFIEIKLVVYTILFFLYLKIFCKRVRMLCNSLDGKLKPFIAAPTASLLGFYLINMVTNDLGIMPNDKYFLQIYVPVCVIFILEYYQIFSSVFWSASELNAEKNK